ncbi:uncharacterized protein LOC142351550 [Convolutriloba macropyga]|uniref:uncharacterized protein LOC142351550 n=1 Tax=Convolutriloba macropyga TaxID=536237 RepID=UPI003F51AC75
MKLTLQVFAMLLTLSVISTFRFRPNYDSIFLAKTRNDVPDNIISNLDKRRGKTCGPDEFKCSPRECIKQQYGGVECDGIKQCRTSNRDESPALCLFTDSYGEM